MKIIRAEKQHLEQVALLFDLYRQFYDCEGNLALARSFISERIDNDESVIFLALDEEQNGQGFVQLYPSFCSVEAIKIMILYDLYVVESARGSGCGKKLMQQARTYSKEQGFQRIDLLTAKDNIVGQSLYEGLGYYRSNQNFYGYSLDV